MILSFENLTAEVNVYDLMKQSDKCHTIDDVCMIESLVVENFERSFPMDPLSRFLNQFSNELQCQPPHSDAHI